MLLVPDVTSESSTPNYYFSKPKEKPKPAPGERARTFQDRIVSGLNGTRYVVEEPLKLRLLRMMHEKDYSKQEKNPLVTVYTPTYNRAKLLMERALPSVLDQSYKNIEYVIIGDCCTDETADLVKSVKDKRIRFYNLPKKCRGFPLDAKGRWFAGPVGPANVALGMAKGRWIARIDDDDSFTKDHVESLLRFAQEGNHEFVSAAYKAKRQNQEYVVDVKDLVPRIGGTSTWLYRSYLKGFKYNINCWRKSWNCVNDIDLVYRLYKSGVRMCFLDKVVSYVFPRPGEQTIGLEAYKEAEDEGRKTHSG